MTTTSKMTQSGTEDTVYRTVIRGGNNFLKPRANRAAPLGFPRSSYPKFVDEIFPPRDLELQDMQVW